MRKTDVKKILVIRFRQIGDSILAGAMCSSLKQSFPSAEVHMVLNSRIAPIFEHHPDIDRVITFSDKENKNILRYLGKIIKTVHKNKYDIIVDMRSTVRTLFFSLFSLRTPFRIGRVKGYTRFLLNHRVDTHATRLDMIDANNKLLTPLNSITKIKNEKNFRLYITDEEKESMRQYMERRGIDFSRPVLLVGVTTKLLHKRWNEEYMEEVLRSILDKYPRIQIILNYAPGRESEDAHRIYNRLGSPDRIKIDIEARSLRELMALCSNCTFYFGNEGGTRHMAQALGIPSFAIYSPGANKFEWMPCNDTPADGIEPLDIVTADTAATMEPALLYNQITADIVCKRLFPHLSKL